MWTASLARATRQVASAAWSRQAIPAVGSQLWSAASLAAGCGCGNGRVSADRAAFSTQLLLRNLGVELANPVVAMRKKDKKKKVKGRHHHEESSDEEVVDIEELGEAIMDALQSDMERPIGGLKRELSKLRGAGATPNMLDHVMVDAYGDNVPLTSVAQVAVKNANLLNVTVFDAELASGVASSITRDADGLNPSIDGNVVKVPIPKATKEYKQQVTKAAAQAAEKTKNTLRKGRRKAMDKLKKQQSHYSKDDVFRFTKMIDDQVHASTEEVHSILEAKTAEING